MRIFGPWPIDCVCAISTLGPRTGSPDVCADWLGVPPSLGEGVAGQRPTNPAPRIQASVTAPHVPSWGAWSPLIPSVVNPNVYGQGQGQGQGQRPAPLVALATYAKGADPWNPSPRQKVPGSQGGGDRGWDEGQATNF